MAFAKLPQKAVRVATAFAPRTYGAVAKQYVVSDDGYTRVGLVLTAKPDQQSLTENRRQLKAIIADAGISSNTFLVVDVKQTVFTEKINEKERFLDIVGSPHISSAVLNDELLIIEGSGASKGIHISNPTRLFPSQKPNIPHRESGLIRHQQFQHPSYFHSNNWIEKDIFSSKDAGITLYGGKRFLVLIDMNEIKSDIDTIIARQAEFSNSDKVYDRQKNNCAHYVYRVLTGEPFKGEGLETQEIVPHLFKNLLHKDSVFKSLLSAMREMQLNLSVVQNRSGMLKKDYTNSIEYGGRK